MDWLGAIATVLTAVGGVVTVWATVVRDREALRRLERVSDLTLKLEDGASKQRLVELRDELADRYADSILSDLSKSKRVFRWGVAVYIVGLTATVVMFTVPVDLRLLPSLLGMGLYIASLALMIWSSVLRRRHLRAQIEEQPVAPAPAAQAAVA